MKKFVERFALSSVRFVWNFWLLLFSQIQDGAYAITIGKWGEILEPLVIVGGNCSINALNKRSDNVLWTVIGDSVSSLALLDFNSDGYNEVRAAYLC